MRFPGNLQQPEDYEEEFYRNKLDNELTFDKRLFEKDAYGTTKQYNGELFRLIILINTDVCDDDSDRNFCFMMIESSCHMLRCHHVDCNLIYVT